MGLIERERGGGGEEGNDETTTGNKQCWLSVFDVYPLLLSIASMFMSECATTKGTLKLLSLRTLVGLFFLTSNFSISQHVGGKGTGGVKGLVMCNF